jgi:hypothetical protein
MSVYIASVSIVNNPQRHADLHVETFHSGEQSTESESSLVASGEFLRNENPHLAKVTHESA